jgi:hypothetical protein
MTPCASFSSFCRLQFLATSNVVRLIFSAHYIMHLHAVCRLLFFLAFIKPLVAPSTRSGQEYGAERRHSRSSRPTVQPYNIEDRRSGNRTRQSQAAGRSRSDNRARPRQMVEYPRPPPAGPRQDDSDRRPRLDRNQSTSQIRPTGHENQRRCDHEPSTSRQALPAIVRAPALLGMRDGNVRVPRWDNSDPSCHPCGAPRPVPPPATLSRQPGTTTSISVISPGLLTALPPLSIPPPPQWHGFLRDLVILLGFINARAAWPRLSRCINGAYTPEVRAQQDAHMDWCRQILIGFER